MVVSVSNLVTPVNRLPGVLIKNHAHSMSRRWQIMVEKLRSKSDLLQKQRSNLDKGMGKNLKRGESSGSVISLFRIRSTSSIAPLTTEDSPEDEAPSPETQENIFREKPELYALIFF